METGSVVWSRQDEHELQVQHRLQNLGSVGPQDQAQNWRLISALSALIKSALLQDDTRVCYVRVHLVEEIAHPVLRVIKRDVPSGNRDIAVVNSGLHYGIGDPKYEEGFAFLKNFIAEHRNELPHIVWKDTSPQHFEYDNGYYWCAWSNRCASTTSPLVSIEMALVISRVLVSGYLVSACCRCTIHRPPYWHPSTNLLPSVSIILVTRTCRECSWAKRCRLMGQSVPYREMEVACRWVDNSKGKTVGPPPEKCRAFTEEELNSEEINAGGWYNEIAFRHMREAGVTIFDAYKITLPMWQMHMKDKDCTHFCNPGAYEVWTYLLSDLLKGVQLRE